MPTIEVGVSLGSEKRVDTFEYDDEDWLKMTEEDKEKFLDQAAQDHAANYVDCWAKVKGEKE